MLKFALLLALFAFALASTPSKAPKSIKQSKSNHDLLTKIGLQRVRTPNSHHRKRLAVESRQNARSDDSHVFIVKLPPNPHYYVHSSPNAIDAPPPSKSIPVGFRGNGKPAKVYHWNVPMIKKIVSAKQKLMRRNNDFEPDDLNRFDVNDPASWNEVLDKPSGKGETLKPIYYVPSKAKKSSFMKYFPGNGKPHSFYVIERSKKAHYHRLLP